MLYLLQLRYLNFSHEITPFQGNLSYEIHDDVQLETHRFALGSQILSKCLFWDDIRKYRYSIHLDYTSKTYHTWLLFQHNNINYNCMRT